MRVCPSNGRVDPTVNASQLEMYSASVLTVLSLTPSVVQVWARRPLTLQPASLWMVWKSPWGPGFPPALTTPACSITSILLRACRAFRSKGRRGAAVTHGHPDDRGRPRGAPPSATGALRGGTDRPRHCQRGGGACTGPRETTCSLTRVPSRYIVYDIAQVNLRYLLKLKFNFKTSLW